MKTLKDVKIGESAVIEKELIVGYLTAFASLAPSPHAE